ncbi:DinB family protein [Roseisalinus antarcticus]|uniref:DinB family protein n=1 Tax=Roseisalinus antarcticus TaxID=254357 RepID=A0A1Y5TYQ4_9RHOB|nr:DinB family protein [Roseisalinus antarcticus]SLN71836.1 DinB family protein [Roseisalinus antarcticus]
MITPGYCQTMARYNAWQNTGLRRIVSDIKPEAFDRDRGAFFGSIGGTLNHLLWGDLIWMSRIAGHAPPPCGLADSATLTEGPAAWAEARFRADGRISLWADEVTSLALVGEIVWTPSGGGARTLPLAMGIMHMFNHQTHHRGQVHAMLTAAGITPPTTDLPFMPEAG